MSRDSAGRGRRLGLAGALLLAILVLALALRLKGIAYGLPYSFVNADESMVVPKAFQAARGHLNPQFFYYPSLYFYLTGALYLLAAPVWWLLGHGNLLALTSFVVDPGPYFLLGRLLSVAMGTASVYLVYRLGRDAFGRPAGLLAALFLAVAPLHVAYSHMAVTDVTAVAFSLLALVLLQRAAGRAPEPARPPTGTGSTGSPPRSRPSAAPPAGSCSAPSPPASPRPPSTTSACSCCRRPSPPSSPAAPRWRGASPPAAAPALVWLRLLVAARVPADGRRVRRRVAVRRARRAALPPRLPPPEPDHGPRLARLRARRQRVLVQPDAQPDGRDRRRARRARRSPASAGRSGGARGCDLMVAPYVVVYFLYIGTWKELADRYLLPIVPLLILLAVRLVRRPRAPGCGRGSGAWRCRRSSSCSPSPSCCRSRRRSPSTAT